MIVELLAAVASGGAIAMLGLLAVRRSAMEPVAARIRELADRPVTQTALRSTEVMRRSPSSIPLLRRLLEDSPRSARWEREISQAGLKLRVGEYLLGRLMFAVLAFLLIAVLGRSPIAFLVGLLCGYMAFMLPAYWLAFLRKRRVERIAKQLPEAVVLISNGLKAGFAFQHGLSMVAEQMEAPIAEEFTRVIVDLNVGASVEEALYAMLERADSEDMNLVVTAIMIQRQSGGNLAEILEIVGETMRERERLTGEVKTMTSQQRFSGTILTIWPTAILGVFALFNWGQTKLLFTTNIGLVLITGAAAGQVLGYITIRKILDVDI
ncbi:MAG: type II secretion system F family protein [Dehalococcoidia bacterium]|nr:type II secretion system F family protein [Dehalococcoidia bacterium]